MNEGMNSIIDPNQSVSQAENKNIFPRKIKSPSRFNKSAQMNSQDAKYYASRGEAPAAAAAAAAAQVKANQEKK